MSAGASVNAFGSACSSPAGSSLLARRPASDLALFLKTVTKVAPTRVSLQRTLRTA